MTIENEIIELSLNPNDYSFSYDDDGDVKTIVIVCREWIGLMDNVMNEHGYELDLISIHDGLLKCQYMK